MQQLRTSTVVSLTQAGNGFVQDIDSDLGKQHLRKAVQVTRTRQLPDERYRSMRVREYENVSSRTLRLRRKKKFIP